jgi:lipid-binding SYLF domain-containing protein
MRRLLSLALVFWLAALPAGAQSKDHERLEECGTVLKEVLDVPENIPQELLDKAECVIIFPSTKKGALGIGGSYGRGAMACRTGEDFTGPWGTPSMYRLEAISVGLQLGGQATDFVLLVMNPRGADSILRSKVRLGANASAAAGPKGREALAATDAYMRAEILTYSRVRGLFAGVSLEGATVRQDSGANKKIYGREVTAREIILQGKVGPPAAGQKLISTLNARSPKNLSETK